MQRAARDPEDDPAALLRRRVKAFSSEWIVGEEPVPEATWHYAALDLQYHLFQHRIAQTGMDAAVFRNLAMRPDPERPQVGMDPDIALVIPCPPETSLSSLRLWEPGNAAPTLVVEVVSEGHPAKDYKNSPLQCDLLGVRELIVFDPMRAGPKALGGGALLHVWRRAPNGSFSRVATGDGPLRSEVLGAYFVPLEAEARLRISDDAEGKRLWLTEAEAALEREAAALEREAAGLARIRELEEELRRRGS